MQLSQRIKNSASKFYWWLPCCLYSADANAWGLLTHLYFAHSLLWAMPILDPRLRNAIKKFPELVMAGACIPDLALISHRYRNTHVWENAHQLILASKSEEELAIAIGYASHLYVDVIAHHHFVPAHEAMWHKNKYFTHIASEWAMDGHLTPLMNTSPKVLLTAHHTVISNFISVQFRCSQHITRSALKRLAFWDGILRFVRLPSFIYRLVKLVDKRVHKHFVYYVAKTQVAIADIGEVLEGSKPLLAPELHHLSVEQLDLWRDECLNHLHILHPNPIDYFKKLSHIQ